MLLVGIAFCMRVSLSIYDCFIPTSQMQTQAWRYFVVYFVDVAFMLIYTTAIFRVIGGWKLLSDLEMQDESSAEVQFKETISKLNRNAFVCLIAYALFDAQIVILDN